MQITQNILNNQQPHHLSIKYKIEQIDDTKDITFHTGAISNNQQLIIAGFSGKSCGSYGFDGLLKIWNYKTSALFKSISFETKVVSLKFTENSKLLYVGIHQKIYQFQVKSNFKKLCKIRIHTLFIKNIFFMTDAIILTSSRDKYIIKTDVILKQQLFKIQAHNSSIFGLDYSIKLNLIASGSLDKSIKLWNAVDGSLIIEKLSTQNQDKPIIQVQFAVNKDQLISLDSHTNLIIWNINYKAKQLEQIQQIKTYGYRISLVLQQQFLMVQTNYGLSVHTFNGEFVRYLNTQEDSFGVFQIQNIQGNDSFQSDPIMILFTGIENLYVLKLEIDPI